MWMPVSPALTFVLIFMVFLLLFELIELMAKMKPHHSPGCSLNVDGHSGRSASRMPAAWRQAAGTGSWLTLQLFEESCQIPEFSDRLKFPCLVEAEHAHAINGDVLARLRRQLEFPVNGGLVAADDDLF